MQTMVRLIDEEPAPLGCVINDGEVCREIAASTDPSVYLAIWLFTIYLSPAQIFPPCKYLPAIIVRPARRCLGSPETYLALFIVSHKSKQRLPPDSNSFLACSP